MKFKDLWLQHADFKVKNRVFEPSDDQSGLQRLLESSSPSVEVLHGAGKKLSSCGLGATRPSRGLRHLEDA